MGLDLEYPKKWGNILEPYKTNTQRFLEIGLDKGITLPIWKEYFNCEIYGIDITLSNLQIDRTKYHLYEMDATDKEVAIKNIGTKTFDVIVDDSSPYFHFEIFEIYQAFLNKNGIYIIETFKPFHPLLLDYARLTRRYPNFNFHLGKSSLSQQAIIYGIKDSL